MAEIIDWDTYVKIVRRARDLIAEEAHWGVTGLCSDSDGNFLEQPDDPRAVRFCALGAIMRASREIMGDKIPRELEKMFVGRIGDSIHPHLYRVNDELGHAITLALLDLAATPYAGPFTKAA